MEKPNINFFVESLLINIGFTEEGLKYNEQIIRQGYNILKEDFIKLIIDVKLIIDIKKIENPAGYFIGAVKNQLKKRGYTQ